MASNADQQLFLKILSPEIADDPEAFCLFAFPWEQAGTPLQHVSGPREWQRKVLRDIKEHLAQNRAKVAIDLLPQMLQIAIASGRGPGKSALLGMIAYWFISTRIGGTVLVSANNEPQLKHTTWGELAKWHAMAINKHWFDLGALSLEPQKWFAELVERQLKKGTKYYRVQAKLWSEENPSGYAGPHNPEGMMVIFDEASGIPSPIWSVAKGFFTEPTVNRFWLCFSNPRNPDGAFFECFHRNRDDWKTYQIDARTVKENDPKIYEDIIRQYGADSREAKIEVYGQFPDQGDRQFISRDAVNTAATRELPPEDAGSPLIMGCDIARYGDDNTVVYFRKGRDARSIQPIKWRSMDLVYSAGRIAELIDKYRPDAVAIDGGGVGGGVVDMLKARNYRVHEVQFGSKSDDDRYANKRTEIWGRMRDDMGAVAIPDDDELKQDLLGPMYKFARNGDQIMLESKEEMKSRGRHSPDLGDALALTYAVRVARNDTRVSRNSTGRKTRVARDVDYEFFSQ